ncbi:hypothetical protein [Kordiimonas sp.]|uniref:hypothetical protein n=1 Tax=Kordiimonas sp. TaxID=1970157 RepID=UPI003B5223AD
MANIRTIYTYIHAAMERQGYDHVHLLIGALKVSSAKFHGWKAGRTKISDADVIKLAELAGMDPHLAVIDAAIWRAEGKPHYKILVETAEIIQSAA